MKSLQSGKVSKDCPLDLGLECTQSADAMSQWVKALATKACWLQFDSWNPGQRKRTSSQELSSKGQACPMGCVSEDMNTYSHRVHMALVNKVKPQAPGGQCFMSNSESSMGATFLLRQNNDFKDGKQCDENLQE